MNIFMSKTDLLAVGVSSFTNAPKKEKSGTILQTLLPIHPTIKEAIGFAGLETHLKAWDFIHIWNIIKRHKLGLEQAQLSS